MALSNEVKAPILADIAANGIAAVTGEIQTAYVSAAIVSTQAALAEAMELSVTDWDAIDALLAGGPASPALHPLILATKAKLQAHDDEGLGPLLLAVFQVARKQQGL